MTINQAQFNAIVEAAKTAASAHPEWLRAIEKAAAAILSGEMIVTTLAHGALVTTPGGTYHANGACDCPARTRHCYHRAGARIWLRYEELIMAPRRVADVESDAAISISPRTLRAQLIDGIKTRWQQACPGVHLADALMARFKCNTLEALSTDFIEAINAIL
jgi:hypothetical protein